MLWNYITNYNDFSSLLLNYDLIEQLTYLVKSSTLFDNCYVDLIQNFSVFERYVENNDKSLLIKHIKVIFDTNGYILKNLYYDIGQFRTKNYLLMNNIENRNNSNRVEEQINLQSEEIDLIKEVAHNLTHTISDFVRIVLAQYRQDDLQNYTGFDFRIKSVSQSFNYLEYFIDINTDNREKYNSYLPFIDSLNFMNIYFQ